MPAGGRMSAPRASRRVVITGVGVVATACTGGWAALDADLRRPRSGTGSLAERGGFGTGSLTERGDFGTGSLTEQTLAEALDGLDTRRLSRACQLAVAAARLAVRDAGDGDGLLGVVVGSELGDLRSTREFTDGYRARGQAGLSALLFPHTVMNTMASATSIALGAR